MTMNRLTVFKLVSNADEIFHKCRWAYGIVYCPYCCSTHVHTHAGNFTNTNVVSSKIAHAHTHVYKHRCMDCKRKFTDKTKTLLHKSKLGIDVWMLCAYELINNKSISSYELSKKLGVSQKTALMMRLKIDYNLQQDNIAFNNIIAQDEMYVGGCLTNYHYGRKLKLLRENGLMRDTDERYSKSAIFRLNSMLKQPVFGMTGTDGEKTVLYAIPNPVKKEYIRHIFNKHAHKGMIVVSDESGLYQDFEKYTGSTLYTNNHHNNQYKTENGYTSNAIENRFSWYKRGFICNTHCKYHQLYLNEYCFRYNTRKLSPVERFEALVNEMCRQSVTYQQIRDFKPYDEFKAYNVNPSRHRLTVNEVDDLNKRLGWLAKVRE